MDAPTQVWVDEIRAAVLRLSTAVCLYRNAHWANRHEQFFAEVLRAIWVYSEALNEYVRK